MTDIDTGDLQPWRVHSEKRIKAAKKSYRCDCCGGPIPVGASYISHFSVTDGPTYERCCVECEKVRAQFAHLHNLRTNPSYFREFLQQTDPGMHPDGWGCALAEMEVRRKI